MEVGEGASGNGWDEEWVGSRRVGGTCEQWARSPALPSPAPRRHSGSPGLPGPAQALTGAVGPEEEGAVGGRGGGHSQAEPAQPIIERALKVVVALHLRVGSAAEHFATAGTSLAGTRAGQAASRPASPSRLHGPTSAVQARGSSAAAHLPGLRGRRGGVGAVEHPAQEPRLVPGGRLQQQQREAPPVWQVGRRLHERDRGDVGVEARAGARCDEHAPQLAPVLRRQAVHARALREDGQPGRGRDAVQGRGVGRRQARGRRRRREVGPHHRAGGGVQRLDAVDGHRHRARRVHEGGGQVDARRAARAAARAVGHARVG